MQIRNLIIFPRIERCSQKIKLKMGGNDFGVNLTSIYLYPSGRDIGGDGDNRLLRSSFNPKFIDDIDFTKGLHSMLYLLWVQLAFNCLEWFRSFFIV